MIWRLFSTFCRLLSIATGAVWVRSYGEGDSPDHYVLVQAEPRRSLLWLSVPGEGMVVFAPRYVLRNLGGDWEKRMVVSGVERAVIAAQHRTDIWFAQYWAILLLSAIPTLFRMR